jgi:hypothetical protein
MQQPGLLFVLLVIRQLLDAIRSSGADDTNPADYHLAAYKPDLDDTARHSAQGHLAGDQAGPGSGQCSGPRKIHVS